MKTENSFKLYFEQKEDNPMKTQQELSDLQKLMKTVTEPELDKLVDKFCFDLLHEQLLLWRTVKLISDNRIMELENDYLGK